MGTKVITGTVRGSNVHLFVARAINSSETPKFGMTALIPKSDSKTLAALRAAETAEIKKKWGNTPPSSKIHSPIHDGDGMKPTDGTPYGAECNGCYVLSVSSKEAPGVVDAQVKPITDPAVISYRDTFRLSLDAFAYETAGRRGVSFALVNVQQIEKAPPKTRRTAAEDFGAVVNEQIEAEEDFLQ